MSAPQPEQVPFSFVADEAIRRCFNILNGERPIHKCAVIWSSLDTYSRLVWVRAAGMDGGYCLSTWAELENARRTRLLLALDRLADFFQKIGEQK